MRFILQQVPDSTAIGQAEPTSNNCTLEYSDKVEKNTATTTLCTTINPASSPREFQLCYSLGRRRALRALIPPGEYHYEI